MECFVVFIVVFNNLLCYRLVHIAEIVIDKLSIYKTVIIGFLEAEGNVDGLT